MALSLHRVLYSYESESEMLGGVLDRYIQGGVTFKTALLFSVYGMKKTRA